MSLPTSKPTSTQSSIRSFFQSKTTPKYAPPPQGATSAPADAANSITASTSTTSTSTPANSSTATTAPPCSSSAYSSSSTPLPPPEPLTPPTPTVDAPFPPPSTNLPREAAIRTVTGDDISALKRINALLLPVAYPDSFYPPAADPTLSGRFSRVITWQHEGHEAKVVGGIVSCVRAESKLRRDVPPPPPAEDPYVLYVQSLCLLSPYRGLGLTAAALDHIMATVASDPALNVKTVTAHVWTENEEGLKWYESRGFRRDEPPIPSYYYRLRPGSAYIMRKPIGATVLNSLPSPSAQPSTSSRLVGASPTAAVVNLPPLSAQTSAQRPPATNGSTPPQNNPSGAATTTGGQSYQKQGPGMEWNDLPPEMAPDPLAPLKKGNSQPGSSASSRSSSAARKKRDRSYPAAAFGS